jgi:hypothetical protein
MSMQQLEVHMQQWRWKQRKQSVAAESAAAGSAGVTMNGVM